MSRTFRRKNQQYDYKWVLIDWKLRIAGLRSPRHDPRSPLGRKAIACYHSDSQMTMRSTAPRWYRKAYDHRRRTRNNLQMERWLAEPEYEPVFDGFHRHDADGTWW